MKTDPKIVAITENKNNDVSLWLFIASFIVVSLYLLSEPFFTFIYSLRVEGSKDISYPTFISAEGGDICRTILWVFAITFIAKNNTGLLDKTIELFKTMKSISGKLINTIKGKK